MKKQKQSALTDLGFLENISTPYKREWTIEKARVFLEYLKSLPFGTPFKATQIAESAKLVGMSNQSMAPFLKELKVANQKGWSLEKYFEAGRPFRPGKQVVK